MNRRKILQLLIGLSVISVVVFTAWYLSSSRFNHFVRARIIRELEDVTGGTVEIKSLRWNLSRLEFEADDLTIHGLEKGNQAPFMHIDSLHIRAKITSLL